MPQVFPFRAVQFKSGSGDVSSLVAPPYDVLDARTKAALLMKDQHNIVAVDLPHTPAKELGPPAEYEGAAGVYGEWLSSGILSRRERPAMFAYRQTFSAGAGRGAAGAKLQRTGMACTVEAAPFGARAGGGILPHEETFSGPKEDRLALMRATRAQLSPIFGLFADEGGGGTEVVRSITVRRAADLTATMIDGVVHEVWTVEDPAEIGAYQRALAGQDVFIADGHHRYTTALNYLKELGQRGPVAPEHPARRCMMVMVGMSDPGLAIWPTHRVLGGMRGYSPEAFVKAVSDAFDVRSIGTDLTKLEGEMARAAAGAEGRNVLGLYDFACRGVMVATLRREDPLAARFGGKPREWRMLDVALVQHLVVEEVCQPELNGGEAVKWAFPHTIDEVVQIGAGAETGAGGGKGFAPQLAVVV
ncbi:MAG: DUF1015 domain-containing protein, partial [Phycisphaerales bacterium]